MKKTRGRFLITFVLLIYLVLVSSIVFSAEPPIKFNLKNMTEYPEFADSYQTQMKIAVGEEMGGGEEAEAMQEMLDINIWVFQVEGDPATILKDYDWPTGTQKLELMEQDLGDAILDLIDNFGDSLTEAWGDDWIYKAEEAASKYSGREVETKTYNIQQGMNGLQVRLVSPLVDPKTMEYRDGTFLVIQEVKFNMGMMGEMPGMQGMEDDEDEDSNW